MSKRILTGQSLGGYHLIAPLGGPKSSVYRARQASLEREVAVETATEDLWHLDEFEQQFKRAAQMVALLEHKHIVPIFDYGVQDNVSYLAMRLLTGGTLADRITQYPRGMDLGEVSALLLQIAAGLDYVHSQGIMHYNVKPRSVVYDQHGMPYLTGFVITKLAQTFGGVYDDAVLYSTPEYMPPEQWRADDLTTATDQYALGITAYEMVCGRPPFTDTAANRIMRMHLNVDPPDPRAFRPDLSAEIAGVLLRALEKDPTKRYPTVRHFVAAFEAARETPPTGYHVFISYSRANLPLMHRLRDALVRAGFAVWTDEDLVPGAPIWEVRIADAIENAAALVVVLSPDAQRSEWITRELSYAELQDVRIFPVLMAGDPRTAVPLRLASTQMVDARTDFDSAIHRLITAIRQPA